MSNQALKLVDKQENDNERRMLEHVRPADHVNPEPAERYHMVVIGAGPAGLVAAAAAAGLGAKVALVEKSRMGGDCLNYGCVPSKGLIRAARAWTEARRAHEEFGAARVGGGEQFAAAIERMRSLRADLSHHDSVARYREMGVDVFLGEGRFTGEDVLEVDGKTLRFRKALIATGARAAAPPIPGLEEAGYLTNETLFSIAEQPRRLAVIGAGPIGCEMSQSFARFGTEVTLLDMSEHVLAREDADAAQIVQSSLRRDGVQLELGVKIAGVELRDGAKVVTAERAGEIVEVEADEILVAAGRAPNVESLGLEQAGVDYDRRGIEVDDRLRTSNRRVYAAGDVASAYKFTHTADAQARIVIQNALFLGRRKAGDLVVPWVTYTSPEVAHVGMTHDQAVEKGVELDEVTVGLDGVDRAVLDGEEDGFVRLYLRRGTDKVIGATLVAEHAGETAGELAVIVGAGVSLGKVAEVIHPYPTQAEVIKKAADAWRRKKLTPRVKRLFDWWFRLTK